MEKLVIIRLYAMICLGAVLLLASCGGNGNSPAGSEPSPWEDCTVGQILVLGGDPCTYPGRSEVVSVNVRVPRFHGQFSVWVFTPLINDTSRS